jgi:hypothetical protein
MGDPLGGEDRRLTQISWRAFLELLRAAEALAQRDESRPRPVRRGGLRSGRATRRRPSN